MLPEDRSRPVTPSPTPLVWFAGLLAAFLVVRATTTLAAGASFELPGTGWRSVWQLAIVVILGVGLAHRPWLRHAVGAVAVVYLASAVVELVTPDALFGVIPVDMRDRVVHPAVGLIAAALLLLSRSPRAQLSAHRA